MTEQQAPYSTSGNVKVNYVSNDDLVQFFIVLRRALLMIVRWIEKTYPEISS